MLRLDRAERLMSSSILGVGDFDLSATYFVLLFLSTDALVVECRFLVSSLDGEVLRGVMIGLFV